MANILLTGGTGYLGSNLCKALLKANHNIIFLKRTFSKAQRVESVLPACTVYDLDLVPLQKIFEMEQIDLILHCATDYGRKDVLPMRLIEANLALPLTLLQLANQYNVSTFINTDTILDKRVSTYSLSKRQFFEWMQFYSGKLRCINVAIEHFYGPGDDPSKFVTMIIQQILGESAEIALTPGMQKRDFIYIDDVVSGFISIIKSIENMEKGLHRFEIGSGQTISIRDFVSKICELVQNKKTKLKFGALPYRENEVMETKVDLASLLALGWKPKYSLDEGLKQTIEFEGKKAFI